MNIAELQKVVAIAEQTYFVSYPGSLVAGEILEIPNVHRREGDVADNSQVAVVIQNTSATGLGQSASFGYQVPFIHVLDAGNVICREVWWPEDFTVITDQKLKLFATSFAGYPTAYFNVMVFYRKPDR